MSIFFQKSGEANDPFPWNVWKAQIASDILHSFRFRNGKCLVQNAYEWLPSTYFRVANIKSL